MANKGKIQANIERLKESKKNHLSKADKSKTETEERHYRMLAGKNQLAINKYREVLDQ